MSPADETLFAEEQHISVKPDRFRKFFRLVAVNIAGLVLILTLWQLVALWITYDRGVAFPTPLQTWQRLFGLFSGQQLYDHSIIGHLSASLGRWLWGYGLAVIIGLFAGLVMGAFPLLYEISIPMVHAMQLIPGLAWIPIALLIFGLGDRSTIFMIFAMGLTPIIINTASGARAIPSIFLKTAQMMGAGKRHLFFQVMLPGATLSIISGLRIGLANSWRVLIAAEMIVGSGRGLGYAIIQSRWSLDFEASFVCVLLICFMGFVVEKLIFEAIEQRIMARVGLKRG